MSGAIDPWVLLEKCSERSQAYAAELGAATGAIMNAKFSLEAGETKQSVIDQLARALARIDAYYAPMKALAHSISNSALTKGTDK